MNLSNNVEGMGWGAGTILFIKIRTIMYALVGNIRAEELGQTIVYAAIGATVGFFIHLFWNSVIKKFKK